MDGIPSIETFRAILTVLILFAAVYSFVKEKIPPDLTALLALLALLVTGVLTPWEAFSGFSHPATISVAAVLVLSAAIERSGALVFLTRRVLEPLGKSEFLFTIVIMIIIAAISAFVNNTAAVAIFLPMTLDVCRRTGMSPGRVLMPMAHAATMGGMCSLIGTSTNLVSHEFALSEGLRGFSMFELGKVGLPMLVAGFVYMLLIGRWFLPKNKSDDRIPLASDDNYLAELIVQEGSSWIDREISSINLKRDYDIHLINITRDGKRLNVKDQNIGFQIGDSILVQGSLKNVLKITEKKGIDVHRPGDLKRDLTEPQVKDPRSKEEIEAEKTLIAEVVVLSSSGLIGKTIKSIRFFEHFNATVLAFRRRGGLRIRPSTAPLHAGDVLVIEGHEDILNEFARRPGFLVIGTPIQHESRPGRLGITLLTLASVILVVTFGLAPIVTAASAGCALLMLTGCLRPDEAYKAIDLSLIFLLAGSLALGVALEKTGVTSYITSALVDLTRLTGPYAAIIGFFVVSVIVSELMSNSGTVALLGPMAISTANTMGINPMSLLAAVTFGSSAAFAMPFGYQTSLMIYNTGGYRFKDFLRMGLVLDLLLAVLALWLIPHYWPLK